MSPKILYITCRWTHPASHGGQLGAFHVARALQRMGEVTLATVGVNLGERRDRTLLSEALPMLGESDEQPTGIRGARALVGTMRDPGFVNLHALALQTDQETDPLRSVREDFDLRGGSDGLRCGSVSGQTKPFGMTRM